MSSERLSAEDREDAFARLRHEIQEMGHWATGRGCEACEPAEECGACGRPLDHEDLPARLTRLEEQLADVRTALALMQDMAEAAPRPVAEPDPLPFAARTMVVCDACGSKRCETVGGEMQCPEPDPEASEGSVAEGERPSDDGYPAEVWVESTHDEDEPFCGLAYGVQDKYRHDRIRYVRAQPPQERPGLDRYPAPVDIR